MKKMVAYCRLSNERDSIETVRVEAIKEFAKRLKNNVRYIDPKYLEIEFEIDKLVEELTMNK